MSSENPLLRLEGVCKSFSGLCVLDGLSFDISPGEVVGLVGPNGSGKTTVINLVSGVLRPDAGHIFFAGRSIERWPVFRRAHLGINRTFQVPKPFREMTVRQNIEVAAHFGGKDRVDPVAVMETLDLLDQADCLAESLTANQQKMLDLGRALATDPKLLLVDEIGAGLNPGELADMAERLQGIAARGVALLIVEHLLDFLARITDRVMVMGAGRLLFQGSLQQAAENPDVVAAFIGG